MIVQHFLAILGAIGAAIAMLVAHLYISQGYRAELADLHLAMARPAPAFLPYDGSTPIYSELAFGEVAFEAALYEAGGYERVDAEGRRIVGRYAVLHDLRQASGAGDAPAWAVMIRAEGEQIAAFDAALREAETEVRGVRVMGLVNYLPEEGGPHAERKAALEGVFFDLTEITPYGQPREAALLALKDQIEAEARALWPNSLAIWAITLASALVLYKLTPWRFFQKGRALEP